MGSPRRRRDCRDRRDRRANTASIPPLARPALLHSHHRGVAMDDGRGVYSSTSQLNVSTFGEIRWMVSVAFNNVGRL